MHRLAKRALVGALLVISSIASVLVATPLSAGAQEADAHLVEAITEAAPADGGSLKLDSVAGFDPAGGEALIDPASSSEERFYFGGVDTSTSELLNVTRPAPAAHGAGSVVRFVTPASPTPSPSTSETSSPTPTDETDTTSDPTPAPEQEASSDESSTTTNDGSGTTSADIPDPCETHLGRSCSEFVQDLIDAIAVDDPCDPNNTGQTCDQMVTDLLSSACDLERSSAAAVGDPSGECLDRINELVAQLIQAACGDGGLSACVKETEETLAAVLIIVDGYVNFIYRTACGYDTEVTCLNKKIALVQTTVNGVIDAVCNDIYSSTSGVDECLPMIQKIVNDAVNGACSDETYGEQGAIECVNMAVELIGYYEQVLRNEICAYQSWTDCASRRLQELQALIDSVVHAACDDGLWGTSGTTECVNRINEALNDALGLLYSVLVTVCGSSNTSACADNLLFRIGALVEDACGPIQTDATATSSAGTLDHPCEERVIEIVNFLLLTACNTTDVVVCIDSTRDELTTTLLAYYDMVWRSVCPESATDMCIERYRAAAEGMAMGLYRIAYDTLCAGRPTELDCANAYANQVVSLVNYYLEVIRQEFCGDQGWAPCIAAITKGVEDEIARIKATIEGNICNGEPDEVACANTLINLIIQELSDQIAVICGPYLLLGCEQALREKIDELLGSSCPTCVPVPPVEGDQPLPGKVYMRFTTPDGQPMSGATFRVYLKPPNPPPAYVPPLVAAGIADANGAIGFDLPDSVPNVVNSPTVDLLIRAVDSNQRWLLNWAEAVSAVGGFEGSYVANVDISAHSELQGFNAETLTGISLVERATTGDTDTSTDTSGVQYDPGTSDDVGAVDPTEGDAAAGGRTGDEATRWVKVAQHHTDRGLKSTFVFTEGRETVTGIALKVGSGNWQVGGSMTEARTRTSTRTLTRQDFFHRVRYAEYRYYKYRYQQCSAPTNPPTPPNCYYTYTWEPDHWTGDMAINNSDVDYAGYFDHDYAVPVNRGGFTRDSGRNRTFEAGVELKGLSLMSRAGYSSATSLKWVSVAPDCDNKWVYGDGQDPTVSRTVYAFTTGC